MTRVATGRGFQARVMGDTASTGTGVYAAGNWMALSATAPAVADSDTALTGELTGTLARAQCTWAYTSGASSYTLTKTFTSDQTVQPSTYAILNAATTGTLVFKGPIPSPPSLVAGDQLTNTETVTL